MAHVGVKCFHEPLPFHPLELLDVVSFKVLKQMSYLMMMEMKSAHPNYGVEDELKSVDSDNGNDSLFYTCHAA